MADVYKIAVEIALAGSIVQGLEAISAKLLGIQTKVGEVEGGLKRWALGIGGVASIIGGGLIFKGMEKVVEAGGELVKQQTLLKNMGVSESDLLETTAKAQLATHQVIGTTISENIKGIRELMGVMPSLHEAQEKYVSIMRGAKVLESLTGTPAEQSLQILAKAVELRGGGINPKTGELDPERLEKETQAAVKAIIASGGLVNQRQLLNLMQQAGPMARSVEDADAFYKGILTAVMDMGGFRAGTALTAVGRQLLGGKMTKPTAEEMERLGLLDPKKWHKSGTGVFVEPGGLKGEDILKDPSKGAFEWFNKVLIPAFKEHGITKNADIQQELYRAFGTETARRLAGLFIQNHAQVARDAELYDKALGGQAYENIAGGDLKMNVDDLHKSFTSFLQSFGSPLVKPAIAALQSMSGAMKSLTDFSTAHPTTMKIIGEALVALSVGLIALGGAAVLAAAAALIPGGIIGAAIVGIGTAIAALAAMNWGAITDAVKNVATAINGAFAGFITGWNAFAAQANAAVNAAIDSIIANFVSAITGMGQRVVDAINHAIGGLFTRIAPDGGAPIGDPGGVGPIPQNFMGSSPGSALHAIGYRPLQSPDTNPAGAASQAQHGRDDAALRAIDFRPTPQRPQPVVFSMKLDLDGRTLAEALSTQIAQLLEHPTSAPYWNGNSRYEAPDSQAVAI